MEPPKDPTEATITTPHSGRERRRKFVLQRIDSQKTLESADSPTTSLRNSLIKMDSEASLTIDTFKEEKEKRRSWRRKKGQEEMDKRIQKSMKGKDLSFTKGDSSGSTWMNSSLLLLDNSSFCSTRGDGSSIGDPPEERRVSFSTAEFREYKVTVAVNHFVDYAITLDWEYAADEVYTINLDMHPDRIRTSALKPLNTRKRQQRLLSMGIPKQALVALERRRRILLAGEWAFGNNSKARPYFAQGKILDYSMF